MVADVEASSSLQKQRHNQNLAQIKTLQSAKNKKVMMKENNNAAYRGKTKIEKIYTRDKIELNLATHNINELKSNNQKVEVLYAWALDNSIDILELAEMNITAKEGNFLTKSWNEYKNFWASADPNKKKGSGVGLLIGKQWEKHLGQIDRISEYMITANFMFKQAEILVVMVYIPPNNKIERSIIQKALVEKYIKRSSRTQMIIMGDLNCIVDADLDRLQKSKQKPKKQDPLIRWLSRQELQDAYRVINPNERKFSWLGREQETRIDYI